MDAQPTHVLLQPYKPSAGDPYDAVKAAHLLNRAGFGGTQAEVAKVMELGPAKAVDWLMDFPDAAAAKQPGSDTPDFAPIDAKVAALKEQLKQVVGPKDDMPTDLKRRDLRQQIMGANYEALRVTLAWWMRRMTYGPHPLQEKLALFWHGHFTTSDKDERSASYMWRQNELLRANAAGNFRAFCRAISRDPAMLDYLNNNSNRKQHPNENYARELMELFTLGIGNYTEQDVKEAARAFTGWAHDGDDFVFRKGLHDYGPKTVLGRTGNLDGDDLIDVILSKPAAGRFVGGKLFRYFVQDDPEESIVNAVGRQLQGTGYELRPVLRTILTSRAFYAPSAIGGQIKSPVQLMLGTVRQVGLEMPPDSALLGGLRQMGQVPFQPPNVRGWPGGRSWINTATLLARYNAGAKLLDGRVPRTEGQPLSADAGKGAAADAVVDHWVATLIQRPIADDKRKVLLGTLAATDARHHEDAVRKVVQLIVAMPEYQLC